MRNSGRPASTVPASQRRTPDARGTVLFAGFGLTIVLWLAAAWTWPSGISRQPGDRRDDDRFLASEQALADLRVSVLLGAIDWRDALLRERRP